MSEYIQFREIIVPTKTKRCEYIQFREIIVPTKTKRWEIISKSSGFRLGIIKLYAPWRQYCFFPERMTIWNKDCLEDIHGFLKQEMSNRKK
jgi:hypothetical protein